MHGHTRFAEDGHRVPPSCRWRLIRRVTSKILLHGPARPTDLPRPLAASYGRDSVRRSGSPVAGPRGLLYRAGDGTHRVGARLKGTVADRAQVGEDTREPRKPKSGDL